MLSGGAYVARLRGAEVGERLDAPRFPPAGLAAVAELAVLVGALTRHRPASSDARSAGPCSNAQEMVSGVSRLPTSRHQRQHPSRRNAPSLRPRPLDRTAGCGAAWRARVGCTHSPPSLHPQQCGHREPAGPVERFPTRTGVGPRASNAPPLREEMWGSQREMPSLHAFPRG